MSNGTIDLDGLPVTVPGEFDYLVGTQNGEGRRWPLPDINTAAALLANQLDQTVADAEADIAPVIAGLGYLPPVPYAAGILIDSTRTTVEYEGKAYAPLASAIPFTTSGTFETASFRLIQGVAGPDLASTAGAGMVGVQDADGFFDGITAEAALAELAWRPVARGRQDVASVIRRMRDGETIKVVCVGDSITYGQLDSGGTAATPWPARLQAVLQQYYGNASITVVNKGVSGSTVQNMLDRFFTDVTSEAPDLVIFNGGTNDCREPNAITLANYKSDVIAYLDRLRSIPTVLWNITPRFKEQGEANGQAVIDFYRQTLAQEAAARGMTFVDSFSRIHSLYKSRGFGTGLFSVDGSHYSEEGYRYLGDLIFAEAFANDDLFIKPGQFKDARGQWLISDAASTTWGADGQVQDANAVAIINASVRLYLFVEDWRECDLILHGSLDNANATDQALTISNSSVADPAVTINLSPNVAGASTFFFRDYPIPAVRLRPGLNNILLSTTTSARITGFSVGRLGEAMYLASYNPTSAGGRAEQHFGASVYNMSRHGFTLLRDGILTTEAPLAVPTHYFDLRPDAGKTSRWRFRGLIKPGTVIYMGQTSHSDGTYGWAYRFTFDGTNMVTHVRNSNGSIYQAATVAVSVVASPGRDMLFDVVSSNTGWSLYLDTFLRFSDVVPLSMGPVFVANGAGAINCWNPPMKKGPNGRDTDPQRGEQWITFADDKVHLTNANGTEKTLSFA